MNYNPMQVFYGIHYPLKRSTRSSAQALMVSAMTKSPGECRSTAQIHFQAENLRE